MSATNLKHQHVENVIYNLDYFTKENLCKYMILYKPQVAQFAEKTKTEKQNITMWRLILSQSHNNSNIKSSLKTLGKYLKTCL